MEFLLSSEAKSRVTLQPKLGAPDKYQGDPARLPRSPLEIPFDSYP